MARIRSMKPEMRNSLTVASWPRDARLLFTYLWGYLDDHGRGVDDIRLIKADTFPLDDDITPADIDQWLNIMAATGTVCRYTAGGRRYVHCVNWSEHQRPSHPGPSRVPPCMRSHDPEDPPEGFARDSGGSPRGSGGPPIGPPVDRSNGTTYVGRAPSALTEETQVMTLVKSSGAPPESLVPEQGAGSREQVVIPPTAGALEIVRDEPPATTDALVGEWIEHCRKRPPGNVIGQVGKQVKAMLAEGIDAPDVRAGLAAWWRKGLHPSALPSVVNELMNASPTRASPSTGLVERNGLHLKPETATRLDDRQKWRDRDAASQRLALGGTA